MLFRSAEAIWCPGERLLEVMSVRGDTGFSVIIYSVDSLLPGHYPVLTGTEGDIPRPAAVVAARWFTTEDIVGFRGDSGTLLLEAVGARVTLRLTARLPATSTTDTLRVDGVVRRLPVVVGGSRCPGSGRTG